MSHFQFYSSQSGSGHWRRHLKVLTKRGDETLPITNDLAVYRQNNGETICDYGCRYVYFLPLEVYCVDLCNGK